MEILRAAVRSQGVSGVEFFDAEGRNHLSIVTRMMDPGDDPVRARILEWIRKRCKALDATPAREK
jgi:hypothetical protein